MVVTRSAKLRDVSQSGTWKGLSEEAAFLLMGLLSSEVIDPEFSRLEPDIPGQE